MLGCKTKSVWLQHFLYIFLCIQDYTAGKWLNSDQLPSRMPQNAFVQRTRNWARWTWEISPSKGILRVDAHGMGHQKRTPPQLLEDFSSFRSDMKFKQKSSAITLHMTSVSMYLLSASTSLSYFIILLFSHSAVSGSFTTPWTAARQASLSFTISQSLFKLMSVESMMPSSHLILYHLLLLLLSIIPSIKVFSNEQCHSPWYIVSCLYDDMKLLSHFRLFVIQ